MSSPRLFSQGSHRVSRRIFLDGMIDSINSHIMGTHILSKEEIRSINAYFNHFNPSQKEYIRSQITLLLPNWKVETELNANFIFSFLRMIGGTVVGSITASIILSLTDSLVASLLAGTTTTLAVANRERLNWLSELDRNSRMYHFIDSLEGCGLQLPVIPSFFELLRHMSKSAAHEDMLTQRPASQMTPRPA